MKTILLADNLSDGQAFLVEMGLEVDLLVPRGALGALRGLAPARVWRTPAYADRPDAQMEAYLSLVEPVVR